MVHKLGYGNWDELKAAFRTSPLFRFDWFVKSRTTQELARRCDTLIRLVEKENQEYDERERQARKEKKLAKVLFMIVLINQTITDTCAHTICTHKLWFMLIFFILWRLHLWVVMIFLWLCHLHLVMLINHFMIVIVCLRVWHHLSVPWEGKLRVLLPLRNGSNHQWMTILPRYVS